MTLRFVDTKIPSLNELGTLHLSADAPSLSLLASPLPFSILNLHFPSKCSCSQPLPAASSLLGIVEQLQKLCPALRLLYLARVTLKF